MNIVEVAENYKKILEGPPVTCGGDCGEELYSSFDKLYVTAYGECATCTPDDDLERQSEAIFTIIQAI